MQIPLTPPPLAELIGRWEKQPNNVGKLLIAPNDLDGLARTGEYLHWDKLRHLSPPMHLKSEEWWLIIKIGRKTLYRPLPFTDKYGRLFQHALPDVVYKLLHQVDREASGRIQAPEQVTNPQTRDTYLIGSLIEEAITSSQLEGASTTRKVAKEMLRDGRKPRDRSEQMIFNNYRAMQFIRGLTSDELTPSIVFELHRILTENTLDNPKAAGRLRRVEDDIHVVDPRDGVVLHTPPDASELKLRLDKICRFANQRDIEPFVHPVVRAVLLHFMLGYDHPFVDGNGRTARAVFYWSMLRQGYWLTEFVSISRILRAAPAAYARAYLYSETDDNDTTYFVIHQLEVMLRAIADLNKYLIKKASEVHEVEALIRKSPKLRTLLNHRQIALLNHALKHPGAAYRIQGHRQSHDVTYQTARTDLLDLKKLGLLGQERIGRTFNFLAPKNLAMQLRHLGSK